jgi:hypothetical protein
MEEHIELFRAMIKIENIIVILLLAIVGMNGFFMFHVDSNMYELNYKTMKMENKVSLLMSWTDVNDENDQLLNFSGYYSPTGEYIVVQTANRQTENILKTAKHETGHAFWYYQLTDEQRSEYKSIYNTTNETVSNYAKKDVKEDFAESFANYVQCVGYDKKIPSDRRDFFNEYVLRKI